MSLTPPPRGQTHTRSTQDTHTQDTAILPCLCGLLVNAMRQLTQSMNVVVSVSVVFGAWVVVVGVVV
jgi:hypothetical protein